MVRPILVSALLLTVAPAFAGPRDDTMAGISRCASLPSDRAFLDCIYGAAQPMRARLGLSPAPIAQQQLVPPAYGAAPAYAPPPLRAMARPEPKADVLTNVLGSNTVPGWLEVYSFGDRGLFTVTLSNGEIWRQDPSDRARAKWNGRGSDYGIKLVKDAGGRTGQLMVRGDAAPYLVVKVR